MENFINELDQEFRENILQYWIDHTQDFERGGFYGQILHDNTIVKDAPKGSVLNARILWTFSVAYQHYQKAEYLEMARRAYEYIQKFFIDKEFGGVYWMLDADGKAIETKKQIYAIGFTIYAMAEYYKATKDQEALDTAMKLFLDIEEHSFDKYYNGYFEACTREWDILEDLRLSEKDANEKKTMNTHLHILEAYTALYRVHQDGLLKAQLRNLIIVFLEKIIDNRTANFNLFMEEDWTIKSNEVSFGHDIEGSWLLEEAAAILGDGMLLERVQEVCLRMVDVTLKHGIADDGSILNEAANGHIDDERHWWPQAEAMVGFVNAFQLTNKTSYLDAAKKNWEYIKANLINQSGEWYWRVDKNGVPNLEDDKVGPWKCPYHNGRACLEIIHRLKTMISVEAV
ncbi:AGE family epimerase/isomerase [Sediminitomix flava]|uniref:Cellobiose 2-epimerase n=1 Tax=Sediminitomix flava TaxID=379075 RepID=A0A315ZHG0_SEDFL|nr:AGE family epimerase/isomerase [Sediminitomix flava]PWJ44590.1 mannobiose 2-epimerase [Sediminitomix flava]